MATLEQLLVDTRTLSSMQVAVAQRDASMRHKPVAAALVDLGMIDERRFAEWMSKITELPIVDPLPSGAVEQLRHHISAQLAREYQVVPVAIEREALTIATMNPLDVRVLEVLRHATGVRIRPVVAVYSSLIEMLSRFYPEEDEEPTMLRRPPADLRTMQAPMPAAAAAAANVSPYGSETLLAGVGRPFAKEVHEPDAASETRVLPASAPPPSADEEFAVGEESQLDRIERSISELVHAVEKLQRRVDAMDATIARVLSRR